MQKTRHRHTHTYIYIYIYIYIYTQHNIHTQTAMHDIYHEDKQLITIM